MKKWEVPGALRCGMVLYGVNRVRKYKVIQETKQDIKDDLSNIRVLNSDGEVVYVGRKFLSSAKDSMNETLESEIKITEPECTQEIIDEMISKVNKELFVTIIKQAYKRGKLQDNLVNDLLTNWAKSKYLIYLIFGRELTLKKEIEYSVDKGEMESQIEDLCKRFPVYGIHLEQFSAKSFIDNNIHIVPYYYSKYGICKNGEKLSKVLSRLFNDDVFDIELSKILQNRQVKGNICLSIDPIDFLTMSVTKHNWVSCYNVLGGSYMTAPYSIMQDSISMIAFKQSDKKYNFGNFEYQSKQTRSVFMYDNKSKSMIECSAQGSPSYEYYDIVRQMFADKFYSFFDMEPIDFKNRAYRLGYDYIKEGIYSHIRHDIKDAFFLTNNKIFNNIKIGVDTLYNLFDGSVIKTSNSYFM